MRGRVVCGVAAAGILLAAASGFGAAAGVAAVKPQVEVAFVLDSTGSMGGLIEGAKQKIWSIANSIIGQKPTPEVRIGLITYRDRGDEYIAKRFDLTDDIDEVFKNLQSFAAGGGGDDEESVNEALHEAVTDLSWSADRKVLKIVFLVGDYPPHMDYGNDVKYPDTCKEAAGREIIINTVQCGAVPDATRVWQDIARRAEGAYVALAQSGNMTVLATPYDEEIAAASEKIGRTVVAYGDKERQAEAASKVEKAASAPAAVAADRAAYNLASGGKAIQGKGDLVNDILEGDVDLSRLKAEELPPEMQKMNSAQRTAYIEKLKAERDALNATLSSLAQKRADYITREQARLNASGTGDSFDAKVAEIIASEASRKK